MKSPLISSKKLILSSQFNYFDLLPMKKFQQCTMRIPETVLLEKGFVKDWVFNSHKIPNHPILKKKKQNLTPMSVAKTFCIKNGYSQATQGCTHMRDLCTAIKQAIKQQKDYDFIKDKKVIQITTVSNQILIMTLVQFLQYASQNKYSQQNFYQKWKIIQQKVSFTKIDEYYNVENVRNNHVIESKCQKIISVITSQTTVQSTQLQDDPYRKNSPNKNFTMAETKNLQGYKFFDTFLNKKFFQMSAQLIEFIEKNLKCLVQSVITKFVINKQRQPHLVGISNLQIKPAKKIADMKQFQLAREKGFVKIQQYQKCLQVYVHENMQKLQNYNINTPIRQRRKKCRGKFCKTPLLDSNLPAVVQYKLKLPTLSANTRVVTPELRDAVIKRKRRVIQKLIQNKVLANNYQVQQQSSQYETQGEGQQNSNKQKSRNNSMKICQNCYTFYFHVNRLFDLDVYGNLVEKKIFTLPSALNDSLQTSQIRGLNFLTKQEIKRQRKTYDYTNNVKSYQNLSNALVNKKIQSQQKALYQESILKPVTTMQSPSKKQIKHSKSNQKSLTPLKKQRVQSLSKTQNNIKSSKNISNNFKSKVKLDPLMTKQQIAQESIANNPTDTKAHRLLTLTKINQPLNFQQKDQRSKTMQTKMVPAKERRPQNQTQAIQQLIKKLSALPDSSKQELVYYAKKYYKDNLPQQVDRRSFSNYYEPHLYQFMSISPISIHPKRRIKKRPQMSLKRLSQLTDYPQIVSRSQFVFDTLIVNEQTTIPFCILTTKVVNPDALKTGVQFQNIFIINDIFDSFIQHISMTKELLQEDEVYNKRIILFDYPGQSHTIYNRNNAEAYSAYFCQVLDKLVYHLSQEKGQMQIINLDKDSFKFCGFGYGGYLLAHYLGSYQITFSNRLAGVLLVNSFVEYPKRYKQILQSLLELYNSNDPTLQNQSHLYYNKAINSEQTDPQQLQHKSGLNPIRVQDRIYLLKSILQEHKNSLSTSASYSIYPEYFEQVTDCQVSVIYGKNNTVVDKNSSQQFLKYKQDKKRDISNRVFVQIDGGHDIFADNYQDIFRVLTLFARK